MSPNPFQRRRSRSGSLDDGVAVWMVKVGNVPAEYEGRVLVQTSYQDTDGTFVRGQGSNNDRVVAYRGMTEPPDILVQVVPVYGDTLPPFSRFTTVPTSSFRQYGDGDRLASVSWNAMHEGEVATEVPTPPQADPPPPAFDDPPPYVPPPPVEEKSNAALIVVAAAAAAAILYLVTRGPRSNPSPRRARRP